MSDILYYKDQQPVNIKNITTFKVANRSIQFRTLNNEYLYWYVDSMKEAKALYNTLKAKICTNITLSESN